MARKTVKKTVPAKSAPRAAELDAVLQGLAKKLSGCRALRKGLLVVRAVGRNAACYCLDCSPGQARVLKNAPPTTPPLIEMIGDPLQMAGVLGGTKDAQKRFFAGGFRIRGNIRYASDLGIELGILKQPIGLLSSG